MKKSLLLVMMCLVIQAPLQAIHRDYYTLLCLGVPFHYFFLGLAQAVKGYVVEQDWVKPNNGKVSPRVESFVRDILREEKVKNADTIHIVPAKGSEVEGYEMGVYFNRFYLNQNPLRNALDGHKIYEDHLEYTSEQYVSLMKGGIRHEAAHIRNNDSYNANFTKAGIGAGSMFVMAPLAVKVLYGRHPLIQLSAALGAYICNRALYVYFDRKNEMRADDAIRNIDEVAMCKRLFSYHAKCVDRVKENKPAAVLINILEWSDPHPTYAFRADFFEQREKQIRAESRIVE